ncbi:uncharacterized protein [Temnothorax nylanderi]|uniref:uncharacterized protein n=1 Tax=Temnothorax nylanderi TaxID=102681 RepID=UPI003A835A6E
MAPTRKRSKLWNYFEELNPSLVKCTTCKKEIKTPIPKRRTKLMRAHILNVHGISLDDETVTLPDDLKKYYSELPEYKAKCNNCGKAVSFLSNMGDLRKHLRRRHSIKIQSRDETTPTKRRSKLWNYFEELKPLLVKCTTCKREIKVSHPTRYTKLMRLHLSRHGIFIDNDVLSLPDDLKQYYSELPRYKAKCKDCDKTLSFLSSTKNLRKHLRRHSTSIQSPDEPSTSNLADDSMGPSARHQGQDTSGLLGQSFIKETTEKTGALNELSTSSSPGNDIDPNPEHQGQETIDLALQSCEQSRKETKACDGSSTLSLADYMDPTAKRQSGELSSLPVQSFKETTERTGALNEPGNSISTGYNTNPTAECQSQESSGLPVHSFEQTRKETSTFDKTVIMAPTRKHSKLWNYFEELNSSLVKCTTCKKEIKTPNPTNRTKIMRAHLFNVHEIFLDNDTLSLPDDLKQYYSELPGYKAKCNNCGETVSFLSNTVNLRRHLRRHSTRILSRDETVMVPRKKRSKLWNYFKKLKPLLVKCTICKREIKVSYPTHCTKLMRMHLSRHGIFLDNDTHTLPDDLKQYYSELPGYKAKCNNCGKTLSFLTHVGNLRTHLRRHSTSIQSRDETVMVPRKKRSKLWNYFEELKPTLVKCTICKKEIKIPHRTRFRSIFRVHLVNVHGISLDDDTVALPNDLRQCYSELPGYKAKCNNCGETVSFLTNIENLRTHLRRHSTITQSQDKTVMVPRKKRSKLWNYFEELKPTLVKCTTCKKEIKIPHRTRFRSIFRVHLVNVHGISLDDDTVALPNNLRQCYSELPGYKAKCNNCGETVSFLTNIENLRRHLRRHSTITQSQDKTVMVPRKKRSKLWNYFEELKPTLVKCTTCKKEIKVSHPKRWIKVIRIHLSRHGIFIDNDTFSLPDDLRQCYSKLPGYKAKCNNCGKAVSFLTNIASLRVHLRRYCTRILSRDETSTSNLADDSMGPSARHQGQDTSGLLVQSFIKETTEKTGTLNELSTSSSPGNDIDPNAERQETIDLALQSCEQSRKETKACEGTSSLADNSMDPSADRQSQDTSDLPIQSLKEAIEKTGALDKPSTLSSTAYIMDLSTGEYIPLRQSQEQVPSGLPVQLFKETAENTGVLNEPSTSSLADYVMDPSAEYQSGEQPSLPVQSFEQMTEETSALHSCIDFIVQFNKYPTS